MHRIAIAHLSDTLLKCLDPNELFMYHLVARLSTEGGILSDRITDQLLSPALSDTAKNKILLSLMEKHFPVATATVLSALRQNSQQHLVALVLGMKGIT